MIRLALFLFLLIGVAPFSFAHEMQPAYLELQQTNTESYDVLWKVPSGRNNQRLSLYVRFPENTNETTSPITQVINGAYIQRWTINHPNGLDSETIFIDGLSSTMTDVFVRIESLDGNTQVTRLVPDAPSFVVKSISNLVEVAKTYLLFGIKHILLGIDHLLFVLALLILVTGWKRLVATITAFTIAHSITLALATLGFVKLPGPPVEAIIALSIVFVAVEIIRSNLGQSSLTKQFPWVVAFIFGLLHGLGFASALHEIGLPQNAILLALLLFNVGVEIGQLLFASAALGIMAATVRLISNYSNAPAVWPRYVAPYVIGSVAMFWLIERVSNF